MGDHILKILLAELTTLRVTCPGCHTAIDVPIRMLATLDRACCPCCNRQWVRIDGKMHHFEMLQKVLQDLANPEVECTIEFPVLLERDGIKPAPSVDRGERVA